MGFGPINLGSIPSPGKLKGLELPVVQVALAGSVNVAETETSFVVARRGKNGPSSAHGAGPDHH